MPLRTQVLATLLLAALVAGGWLWLTGAQDSAQSSETPKRKSGPTLVLVETLALAEDRVSIRLIGTGEAYKSATIHSSVAGEVVDVAFEAEQRVSKGDVLLKLDANHERLAVRLAEVAVAEASRQLKRLKKLAPSGAASQARLETSQSELDAARVRRDQAKEDLADRRVVAPFAGVIGLTEIEAGDRIYETTPIATLDDRTHILVAFDLPEIYAGRVRLGNEVNLRPWTMREQTLSGKISTLGSRIDPVTRSLRVKARINNTDDILRPGTSFEVELSFIGQQYPAVREVAVLWSRDGAYVWRVTGGKAEKVFVKIVRRDAGRILVDGGLVEGGLAAGDTIVVEGVQGLRKGQRLKAEPFDSDKTVDAATTTKAKP